MIVASCVYKWTFNRGFNFLTDFWWPHALKEFVQDSTHIYIIWHHWSVGWRRDNDITHCQVSWVLLYKVFELGYWNSPISFIPHLISAAASCHITCIQRPIYLLLTMICVLNQFWVAYVQCIVHRSLHCKRSEALTNILFVLIRTYWCMMEGISIYLVCL